MNSLPSIYSSINKVKIRSKTTSFKRPLSYDVLEATKKDSKGLLFSLKRGISNSKLHENSGKEDVSKFCITENKSGQEVNVEGRIQGRKFDSDDDEDYMSSEGTSVTRMAKFFDNGYAVLNNPALFGYLLIFMENHNINYNHLLYYLVVQYYKMTVNSKEFNRDAPRFANEIITTFIHDKSNLIIDYKVDTVTIMEDLNANRDVLKIFDKSSEEIFDRCIKNNIYTINQSIKHGLFNLDIAIITSNSETKMNFLNKCISHLINSLENKVNSESKIMATKEMNEHEEYLNDIIISVKTSLATIYSFYSKNDKDFPDNMSLSSHKHLRSSFMLRSTESLQSLNNFVLDKQQTFCSKMHKKSQNYSFFKKIKNSRGHNFQENIFKYPAECFFCKKLLWGINPQGYLCIFCQEAVHVNCKDFVHTNCSKDVRKPQNNQINSISPNEDGSEGTGGNDDDSISVSNEISNMTYALDSKNPLSPNEINENQFNISNDSRSTTERHTDHSTFSVMSQNANSNIVISPATIYVTNEDTPSANEDYESNDSVADIISNKQINYSKSETRSIVKGMVKSMARKYDSPNISRSQSDEYISTGKFQISVPDLCIWNSDTDMAIAETFEAHRELERFANHPESDQYKADYTRLLVLMEFHHKIKFTVMTLKRFDYLLIREWPKEDTSLFKTLSLNTIIPLYELIKTLNSTIEGCKNNSSYSDSIAQSLYDWLVLNDGSNLKLWLKYSIDLCCTNSLNSVKNSWKEYITDPKYTQVLTSRHNKMIMIEQLSNMRPLLFNLPLIVGKIHKDLSKFPKFKDENVLWKKIHEKFKELPTFIDEYCMPLVQLINNGSIVNSMDSNNWFSKLQPNDPYYDFISDFPKTAFHPKLFDFQKIKMSDFKENTKNVKNVQAQVLSARDRFDAYAICYDNILVLLKKENEKYYLKEIKTKDTSSISPILVLENVHVTKGYEKRGEYELVLVFINDAILAQIIFLDKDVRNRWQDFICKMKENNSKNKVENPISTNSVATIEKSDEVIDIGIGRFVNVDALIMSSMDKYSDIKEKWEEFILFNSSFLKDELQMYDKVVIFQKPTNENEFLFGTLFDSIKILKTCYDSLSICSDDDITENLLTSIAKIQNRVSNFMKSRTKDTLNSEDIKFEILDIKKGEVPYSSIEHREFLNIISEENFENSSVLKRSFGSQLQGIKSGIYDVISPEDDDLAENNQSIDDDDDYDDDEDILEFVNEYVRKIIEETQVLVDSMSSNDITSFNQKDEHSLQQLPSIITEVSD